MKRKITLLMLAASSVLTMNSQVVLNEHFTNPFSPATAGWVVQNLSSPLGTLTWTQGVGAANNGYDAYDGNASDYYSVGFNSQGTTAGGISNWFITPVVTLFNGAIFQFATKSFNGDPNAVMAPDRMQVRMSQGTSSSIAPTTTAAVGTFTTLLLDINPALNTNTNVTAVTNGTMVNGYPNAWTVYSLTVSGITGTVSGRFAFRYFVEDGGLNGANSNNIGIDAVKYTLPCAANVISYTTCPNQPVTLNATGGLAATTYSWTGPSSYTATGSSITVNSAGSGVSVYTVFPSSGTVSCNTSNTASITTGTSLSMSITATATNICNGGVATLTAISPAANFAWGTTGGSSVLGTTPSITIAPTSSGVYTVGGASSALNCFGSATIAINSLPLPTITYTTSGSTCSGNSFSLTGGGGTAFLWQSVSFSASNDNPLVLTAGSSGGPRTFTLFGLGSNGCVGGTIGGYTVVASPTIAVTVPSAACRNTTLALTASGAGTYSWSGTNVTGSPSGATYSYAIGSATGNRTITVNGTSAEGCTAIAVSYTMSTSLCVGIESINGSMEAAIFPNPFSNELKISGLNGTLEIYNSLGQIVVNTTIKSELEVVNTAELSKGLYILKAYNTDGTLTKTVKLLKN